MDEKTGEIIEFMENISLEIEKHVDALTKKLDTLEQFIGDFKGDKKIVDAELKKHPTMNRVQGKLNKLGERLY